MCCFSRPARVSQTRIFARASKSGRQFLVYSMTVEADGELAMILPIPTPPRSPENAVRFINLEAYPRFFEQLDRGFPSPRGYGNAMPSRSGALPKAPLAVVEVGSFVASFVPTLADFDRLDARFRLPSATWDRLPIYKEYGFAVFQLKAGNKQIHPMAFEFPRAKPNALFFPTVHIHDGEVHAQAEFDHMLYCQALDNLTDWRESIQPAQLFMSHFDKLEGLVDPDAHVYRQQLTGNLANRDIWIE